jgi:hypothetical protein
MTRGDPAGARASDLIREDARDVNSDARRVSDNEGDPRSLKPCPLGA